MAELDDILKVISDKEQPLEKTDNPKLEKPQINTSEVKSWIADHVIIVVSIVAVLIACLIGLRMYNKSQTAKIQEQQQIQRSQRSVKENADITKTREREADFLLSRKEYKDNINYLVKADIGLIEDRDKGLTGTLTFPTGKEEVLSYTRKDGVLHTINSKNEPVSRSNKWVRTLIAKMKAQKSINKEQEKSSKSEK